MAAVIQNPLKALGDQFYKDAIEQCRSYNARLCAERSVRLPFLDSQTGVAQNNCYIWMERHHRSPGVAAGQMYTYPARCWRKKRRLHTSMDPPLRLCGLQIDGGLTGKDVIPTQGTTLEALLRGEGLDQRNNSKDEESLLEIQRVLEADAAEDAYHDDYDVDTPKKRHRGKSRGRISGRRRTDMDDQDKPYSCDICGKRYMHRTGLSYHYTHSHLAEERGSESSRSPSAQRSDRHKRKVRRVQVVLPLPITTVTHAGAPQAPTSRGVNLGRGVPAQSAGAPLAAQKRRRTAGRLLGQRNCLAPPRRVTRPRFTALRTMSLKSPRQTARGRPTDTDREELSRFKDSF
ncbi:zinc finger protein DPF3-like isoform X2 [Oncorhynchus keta]|uniref:zinc finger protein DPF3-like isoform X2 n=1 Tax=Oncorhynchus keta TaxID=8018 RepID=UPI00227B35F4|nr:zinc finger protein DPF3-like isoform X2 [Oncorhynchus keta]